MKCFEGFTGTLARNGLVCLGFLACPALLVAQDVADGIISDRPGLGDGAHVVGNGVTQLEFGLDISDAGPAKAFSIGQSLLRFGMGRWEARILPGSAVISDGESGLVDPAVGAKVRLNGPESGVQLSGVASASLPVGSGGYSAEEVGLGGTLVAEGSLAENVGLAVNVGYGFFTDAVGDGTLSVLVTPGFAIPSVEGLGAYGGWAGFFGSGSDRHVAEAGLAYSPDPDTQLDFNLGVDVGDQSEGWFFGVGLARRWR